MSADLRVSAVSKLKEDRKYAELKRELDFIQESIRLREELKRRRLFRQQQEEDTLIRKHELEAQCLKAKHQERINRLKAELRLTYEQIDVERAKRKRTLPKIFS